MIVLGFSGPAGCGKNFIAEQIKQRYKDVELMAFADPLKRAVAQMFDLELEDMYTSEGKKKLTWYYWEWLNPNIRHDRTGRMTVRELQQFIGTELVRNCWNRAHWTSCLEKRVYESKAAIICVTDLRFENEAWCLRELKSPVSTTINFRIFGRGGQLGNSHASEQFDWETKYQINNGPDRTIDDVLRDIENLVPELSIFEVRK